ncbi:MAG TPA: ABC transporter substrate-binding protein [Candidatus Limnocylindrales bacterium]|nr:ABC transporter substrate-binding protein [Candidatus Limnocylindrales bacterium]
MRTIIRSVVVVPIVLAIALVGCGAGASLAPSIGPTVAATVAPTEGPSPTPDACAAANLTTLTAGKLTVGADNPAFPPYFQETTPKPASSVWELGDPTNGKGLESATAYAVAKALGFTPDQVVWKPVPFNNAIQPGPKDFDIYLSQVSYSAAKAKAVDLSDGYFDLNQAVIGLKADAISKVTTVAGLAAFKLGAPVATTSLQYIVDNIKPTQASHVYDNLDLAIAAVNAGQIDGVVVDLPTAFYASSQQLKDGTIVGSLPTAGGTVEHFSIALNLGSPLTACVNAAIAAIKGDGTLQAIVTQWITSQGALELK